MPQASRTCKYSHIHFTSFNQNMFRQLYASLMPVLAHVLRPLPFGTKGCSHDCNLGKDNGGHEDNIRSKRLSSLDPGMRGNRGKRPTKSEKSMLPRLGSQHHPRPKTWKGMERYGKVFDASSLLRHPRV